MNHPHNHNPDATWETHLVIPEAVVDPVLATLLRIEEILKGIVEGGIPRPTLTDRAADPLTPELLGFEQVEDKKTKGKRK